MAYGIVKTEHSGAKKGKSAWMRKAQAKKASSKARRSNDKREARSY